MELMMELNRHIPSTLYIKDTFDYMYISYTGQPTIAGQSGTGAIMEHGGAILKQV